MKKDGDIRKARRAQRKRQKAQRGAIGRSSEPEHPNRRRPEHPSGYLRTTLSQYAAVKNRRSREGQARQLSRHNCRIDVFTGLHFVGASPAMLCLLDSERANEHGGAQLLTVNGADESILPVTFTERETKGKLTGKTLPGCCSLTIL